MRILLDECVLRKSSGIAFGFPTGFFWATLDIEKMMQYRGIAVTYEAIRRWWRK